MNTFHKVCTLAVAGTAAVVATVIALCYCKEYLPRIKDNDQRLRIVRERFKFTWDAYRTNAMGQDEMDPLSGQPKQGLGWGVTLIDSLDTLWLMDMHDEFKEASQTVANVDFTKGGAEAPFAETTFRILGGLLGAYELSQDRLLLDKAKELADVLLKAFDSPSGFPYSTFDFSSQSPVRAAASSLADIGSCQLEFTRLSQLTGDAKYRDAALRVYDQLEGRSVYHSQVDVETGAFTSQAFTLGAGGDVFFEYLVKLTALLPEDARPLAMFNKSLPRIHGKLLKACDGFTCLGSRDEADAFVNTTEHRHFFVPGMLQLADQHLPDAGLADLALELLESFLEMGLMTFTGLPPETTSFFDDIPAEPLDARNALRPELAEALFYAFRHTGDEGYREHAWTLFCSFDRFSRAAFGYAEYDNVLESFRALHQMPRMPSHMLSETLKYFLLIFDDALLPLDAWVLNTGAHPFKLPAASQ